MFPILFVVAEEVILAEERTTEEEKLHIMEGKGTKGRNTWDDFFSNLEALISLDEYQKKNIRDFLLLMRDELNDVHIWWASDSFCTFGNQRENGSV